MTKTKYAGRGRVFVTSTSGNGRFSTWAETSQDGLAGGDEVCQVRANAAGLGGTWTAWLSTDTVDAKDRITDQAYYLVDDTTKVCDNKADLIDGNIDHTINQQEDGTELGTNTEIRTGTTCSGISKGNFYTCNNWTDGSGSYQQWEGRIGYTNCAWTDAMSRWCFDSRSFYCFEDGSSPFLYTYQDGEYKKLSDFIAGATSKEKEYTSFTDVTGTDIADGKVKLKITEELDETAYIDRVYLRVDGNETIELSSITDADIQLLRDSDNNYLVMEKGAEHYLEFPAPEQYEKLEFAAEGYYIEHHNSLHTDYVEVEVEYHKYVSPEPSSTVGSEETRTTSANLTSIAITPSQVASWDKFYAKDTLASGTNITYAILNATDNSTKCTIIESQAGAGYDISSCALGLTSIRLFANLTMTNTSSTPILHGWNVSWDSDEPAVKLDSPADNSTQNTTLITFTCSATDNTQLENITLYNDLNGWASNGTNTVTGTLNSTSFDRTVPSDGTYIWNCYACDNSSNCAFAVANYTVTVDTILLNITIVNPENQSNLSAGTTWTWINISTDENAVCRYNLTNSTFDYSDGTNFTNTGGQNHSFNYSGLKNNESYTLYYKCNDSAGNINPTSVMHVFSVKSTWHTFYGHVTGNITLEGAGNETLYKWNVVNVSGNVYVADADSTITWTKLYALGKMSNGSNGTTDFKDADTALGINAADNISIVYTDDGGNTARNTTTFNVFKRVVEYVPIDESTNNTNFWSGILWDSDDSTDNEFNATEKEDLVFLVEINENAQGKYSVCDYEIKIPYKLQEYKDSMDMLYFYLELR